MAQLVITGAPDFVARPASVYDDRWGVARLVEDTYVITRHLHQKGAIDAARLAPPIPVTYCTVTGEQRTDHLLGLVWLPSDRWVWAVNGWSRSRSCSTRRGTPWPTGAAEIGSPAGGLQPALQAV